VTIPYFSAHQNVVFLPALLALLAATVVVCLPIVFGPALRRSSRRTPVLALVVVFTVVGLVGAAWLAGTGFRTLGTERASVQASIQRIYGVRLNGAQVNELLDGGAPEQVLPTQATAARLPNPNRPKALKLVPTATGADTYVLTIGGRPWPTS
jgi:hypothetical protein